MVPSLFIIAKSCDRRSNVQLTSIINNNTQQVNNNKLFIERDVCNKLDAVDIQTTTL